MSPCQTGAGTSSGCCTVFAGRVERWRAPIGVCLFFKGFSMRIHALATLVVALILTTACPKKSYVVAAAPTEPGHFAVILERSPTGWAAHCEVGCQWTDVTMSCNGCEVQLDASGIAGIALANPSPAPKGFAFVVSDARDGWTARGIQGVRWQNLSWSCGAVVCRGRLYETGVGSV